MPHPGVAIAEQKLAARRARGVGIVYGADGAPKISPGWASGLDPQQRQWADEDLAKRGYRLDVSGAAIKIEET